MHSFFHSIIYLIFYSCFLMLLSFLFYESDFSVFIYDIAVVYGHLAKLYCCHISMILPFEMRNRSKPVATYGLPVGGLPNNGPVFVPLFVHLISTLSPFAKISSCTVFYLVQLLLLQMHISLFLPGPLRNSSGRTGLCKTKSDDKISSATSRLPFEIMSL